MFPNSLEQVRFLKSYLKVLHAPVYFSAGEPVTNGAGQRAG